jgi:hypothetical protein
MAGVAEHHAPASSRTGARQLPASSAQDDTVVPVALRQRGSGSHRGCSLSGRRQLTALRKGFAQDTCNLVPQSYSSKKVRLLGQPVGTILGL